MNKKVRVAKHNIETCTSWTVLANSCLGDTPLEATLYWADSTLTRWINDNVPEGARNVVSKLWYDPSTGHAWARLEWEVAHLVNGP